MIEASLYTALSSSQAITSLALGGIYPMQAPETAKTPYITYRLVGTSERPSFDSSGLSRQRVEINCWSEMYTDAANLRAAVLSTEGLYGYESPASDITQIQDIRIASGGRDFFDHEARRFRCMCELYAVFTL